MKTLFEFCGLLFKIIVAHKLDATARRLAKTAKGNCPALTIALLVEAARE